MDDDDKIDLVIHGGSKISWCKNISNISDVDNDINENISFALEQNYPNPFNPTTNISFSLPNSSDVKIVIFNTLGEVVNTINKNDLTKGTYAIKFSANNLSTGCYFYKLEAGNNISTRKMLLIK